MNSGNSEVHCVAIISPGDMGHAIGRVLREHRLQVITCLKGRSERTRRLSVSAGFREVASCAELVSQADLVLSILVPSAAMDAARSVAHALRATGCNTYFADCNAVAPETVNSIGNVITAAGGRFIDASIIGSPPAKDVTPRLYVSGSHAGILSVLDGKGIDVVPIGDAIGQASGIKMCYAALTKGTFALQYAVATAARKMELFDELCREFEHSQSIAYERMQQHLPRLPAKTFRWIAEMEQIADTFERVGVTPDIHRGAAEMFRRISQCSLADETPETTDTTRTLAETIDTIVKSQ